LTDVVAVLASIRYTRKKARMPVKINPYRIEVMFTRSVSKAVRPSRRRSTSMPNHEPPTIPSKSLKEMAFKRHGDVIQQVLTEAENVGERQNAYELIRRVRKHMEAQRIIAGDLLDEEEQ
jgi:hypothetical protein